MSRIGRIAARFRAERNRKKVVRATLGVLALVLGLSAYSASSGGSATRLPVGAGADADALSQTLIVPPFGPPPTRNPIRVLRSQKQRKEVAAAPAKQPAAHKQLSTAAPQQPEAALPKNFDWRTYLAYNPEVKAAGVRTRRQAEQHYRRHGNQEGRLHRRLRVIMRYTAGTGLMNQHYCHIAAFAVAAALGAEIVLPPAAKRDSFGFYFSTRPNENQVSWASARLENILDVERITALWGAKGMVVHKTPPLVPFPNLISPQMAYPLYDPPGIGRHLVTRVLGLYLATLELDELVKVVRDVVLDRALHLLRDNPEMVLPAIVCDFPVTLFMLRPLSAPALIAEVARDLPFAPAAQALADGVMSGMAQSGALVFNSLHLRIEADAKDWTDIIGGSKVVENEYLRAMRANEFSWDVAVYVASGLLTYGADDALHNVTSMLQGAGLCSVVYHKEQFIDKDTMAELDSEQTALIDFLVLAKGQRFVGFGSSTFSFYLQQYRQLNGVAMATNRLVDILDQVDGQLDSGGRIFTSNADSDSGNKGVS